MIDMAKKDIFPAVSKYTATLAKTISVKKEVSDAIKTDAEERLLEKLSSLLCAFSEKIDELEGELPGAKEFKFDILKCAFFYCDTVFDTMEELRAISDEMEMCTDAKFWPYPSYGELLFSVH